MSRAKVRFRCSECGKLHLRARRPHYEDKHLYCTFCQYPTLTIEPKSEEPMSKTTIEYVAPVPGAATYVAHGNEVYMLAAYGETVYLETRSSPEQAQKAAMRWQKKENAAVTKEAKRVEKEGK